MGNGRLAPKASGRREVVPQNKWEMGGLPPKLVGVWRLSPKTGVRWEVCLQNRWEMGGLPPKQVGDGRLSPKTGVSWEVETPATPQPLIIYIFQHNKYLLRILQRLEIYQNVTNCRQSRLASVVTPENHPRMQRSVSSRLSTIGRPLARLSLRSR